MSRTQRTAMGRTAGPLTPPVLFDSTGRPVSMSSTSPGPSELIAQMASAPAFATSFAMPPMLSTFGESFTAIGQLA